MLKRFPTGVIAGVVVMAASTLAQTPDERAAARVILAKYGDAVMRFQGSTKMRMSLAGQETQTSDESVQGVATVIDGTGLAVTSLSALEPERLIAQLLSAFGGDSVPQMNLSTEPTDLRMRLVNGQELPVKIVLRDEDLNLAYLKPIDAPKDRLPFVGGAGSRLGALDLVVMVTRLGESSSWQTAASFGYIQALIDKPRTVYLLGSAAMGAGFGTPVFDVTGRFVGMTVMKTLPRRSSRGVISSLSMLYSGAAEAMGIIPVVLPANDIREVARQAATK